MWRALGPINDGSKKPLSRHFSLFPLCSALIRPRKLDNLKSAGFQQVEPFQIF